MAVSNPLPRGFRKAPIAMRRELIAGVSPRIAPAAFGRDEEMIDLADVMVESAVGYVALPVGIATGFVIDGLVVDVPMATEEPSVIAAATYAAGIVRRGGGFVTRPGRPVTTGQLFVERAAPDAAGRLTAGEPSLQAIASPMLASMTRRGGGWRGISVHRLPGAGVVRVDVHVDVRDAMGANLVNSIVEALRPRVESLSGGRVVMAILTNASDRRVTTASFSIVPALLSRSGVPGVEAARRIVLANEIARDDPSRAVTHNKGIMNGVSALAAATGNDTRAVEAAVHTYASRDGASCALTRYSLDDDADAGPVLRGEIALPVPLGTVGGAAGIHPASVASLELLGRPDAGRLASIAASLGLAQNFAALHALVTEGIQRGHMGLHAERAAWAAGARGEERVLVAAAMREQRRYGIEAATEALARLRASRTGPR